MCMVSAVVAFMEHEIEIHPWQPFIPSGAKVLIMGTFPPGRHRWSMDFYYPNRSNDFWYMMGLIFYGDKTALLKPGEKDFDLDKIVNLLIQKRIAIGDTARKIRRLKNNASDKFLEIVEPVPLFEILNEMPDCKTLVTTGEKAASVIADITSTAVPKMGEMLKSDSGLYIWRMPSTSRAYPLALSKKAEYYAKMFNSVGVL